MARIISVHEYILKSDVDETNFENAMKAAHEKRLLELPGLIDYKFVKGVKGSRKGHYAAIWIYESRECWEELWGTPENPRSKQDYPKNWQIWEEQVLAPYLIEDPDRIEFTAYEEMS